MSCPAAENVVGSAVLTTVNAGVWVAVTVAVVVGEVTGSPFGSTPVADAVLVTDPASTSAWVVVYVAVHVIDSPGANETGVAGQVAVALSSATVNGADTGSVERRVGKEGHA